MGEDKSRPVFTDGSTMRHVIVMAATGAVGLVAVFTVDLANLLYISMLGQQELAAAIGYAATIIFFTMSFSIGLNIASTAITARAFGARDLEGAHKSAASSLLFTTVIMSVVAAMLYPLLGPSLELLGAQGRTYEIALGFMQVVVPSIPLMGIGMCLSGLLRAKGDARRSMYLTLAAGATAAVVDPILIFGLDLGVTGAAISTLIARIVMVIVGFHSVWYVHRMLAMPDLTRLKTLFRPYLAIAAPAVMTQIATPLGNAYVTGAIARFGDDAVAGWAIIGRVMPLAFAGIFALSGAVGPILSQNYGAGLNDRVRRTMRDSLIACFVYTCTIWGVLAAASPLLVIVFRAHGEAASLVVFFCHFIAASFVFNGALFVANASFNNLGYPMLAALFNWGRATLGTIPLVYLGMTWGPQGILTGWGLGGAIFGTAAVIVCFRRLRTLPDFKPGKAVRVPIPPTAQSPFTTGKGATLSPPPDVD